MWTKNFSWKITLVLGSLMLFMLVACGDGNNGSAKATPTSAPPTTSTLSTYKGDGYEIGYPQSWKVNTGSNGLVTFADPQGIAYVTIHVMPNPNGIISTANQVELGLQGFKSQAKNYQQANISPTATLGGDTWSQGSASGEVKVNGQPTPVLVKTVILANNRPAQTLSTRSFVIAYATGQQVFDLADVGFFQPMLQSFKFV